MPRFLGTDATIHEHIKKIQEREYAFKRSSDGRFEPTPLGIALVEGYDDIGIDFSLTRPQLRAKAMILVVFSRVVS